MLKNLVTPLLNGIAVKEDIQAETFTPHRASAL